jgi:hypothetical protein
MNKVHPHYQRNPRSIGGRRTARLVREEPRDEAEHAEFSRDWRLCSRDRHSRAALLSALRGEGERTTRVLWAPSIADRPDAGS